MPSVPLGDHPPSTLIDSCVPVQDRTAYTWPVALILGVSSSIFHIGVIIVVVVKIILLHHISIPKRGGEAIKPTSSATPFVQTSS
jgi:hypothetical protein